MTIDFMILIAFCMGIVFTPIILLLWNETFEHLQSLTPVSEVEPWSPFIEVAKYWNIVPYSDVDTIPAGLRA